jgi:hypothetical protein
MLRVIGQCYEIRERLKALGCEWNPDERAWVAPDAAHAEAQALADVENLREWREYLGTLTWADGEFTSTVWLAGLRASSLAVPYAVAWAEIAGRVRAAKAVGDRWFDRNIKRAYEAAGAPETATWRPDGPVDGPREKPRFRNETLERVAMDARDVDLAWLAARSPVDPCLATAETFLGALYEPGEHVVIFDKFESQGQWVWSSEEGFAESFITAATVYEKSATPCEMTGYEFPARGPAGIWFLCNPVSGGWRWMEEVSSGDEPHWSRRFHECVTSWRYLVLESDKARAKDWVAMAVQLPFRIAAIYTSGGKSVHVLVRVDAKSKREWDEWRDEMKPIVITLGADQGCMSAVRLTRLPGCFRAEKGQPQKLLYLNPAPDMTPILSRPVVRDAVGPWIRLAESLRATEPAEIEAEALQACRRALEFYASVPAIAALRKGVLRA